MTAKRLTLILLLGLLSTIGLLAQGRSTVKVNLIDSLTNEPVAYSTVYLSEDGTTNKAYYATSSEEGQAIINKVPFGPKYLVVEMMGYKKYTKQVDIFRSQVDLGTVKLQVDIEAIDEMEVTAVGNQIVVKKDTIEINAELIRSSENDVLEDLLKKAGGGIEVSSDGTITHNGETITKVMIEGKEFFLDDPTLATKNIPAKIVQKIKVVQKKSEQAEFTGIDDGEEETVLDLSVKPGMFDTWFGNVTGGGGHDLDLENEKYDARWQGSGIVGHFDENSQFNIILNGNNTNNRGFHDMNQDMYGGMGGMRGGGPWGQSGGITTSWMGGFNGNWNIGGDKDRELGGNYLYNGSIRDIEEDRLRTTFLNDSVSLVSKNSDVSSFFSDGHRANLVLDYKFNDKTSILFRPNFNYGTSKYTQESEYSTFNSELGQVNDGTSLATSDATSWRTNGRILYRQKIGEAAGRTLSLNVHYNISNNNSSGVNRSETNVYSGGDQAETTFVNQQYTQKEEAYSVSADLTYTEPLGKNFYLLGSYRFNWQQNITSKHTDDVMDDGSLLQNNLYTSDMTNEFLTHRIQLSMSKQEEDYTLQIGVNAQPSTTKTKRFFAGSAAPQDTSYTVWNFAPSARFDYRFSNTSNLRINYWGRTSQPSVTQLLPIPDNSDPLYITLGNATLNPEFQHRMRFEYSYTDTETFTTYSVRGGLNYTKDDIINASWYSAAGVRYTAPINSDLPTYGGNMMFMVNSQFGKTGLSLQSFTFANVNSYLTYTGSDTSAVTLEDIRPSLIGGRTTSMSVSERLTLVYNHEYFEARVGGSARYQKAWYEIASQAKSDTWDNSVFAELTGNLPWGMELSTDINYNFYFGYEAGFDTPMTTWNAEISQSFLNKNLTLRLKVYDILNQSRNNRHNIGDNYTEDVYNNSLGRYVMVSLTYRFGSMDKMRQSGPGGHRRGPGGPPPGFGGRR